MVELSQPYVLGLLADLEVQAPKLEGELSAAQQRSGRVDAELSNLLRRLEEARGQIAESTSEAQRVALGINERNLRIATLHQEVASIRRRTDDIKAEMDRVGAGAIQRRLRRERAKLNVQIEDREAEIETLRGEVEAARTQLEQLEQTAKDAKDRARAITGELDSLQSQLPSPYAFTRLFDTLAARAHCNFYLDAQPGPWKTEMDRAVGYIEQLHTDLRLGKYRLDRNSDLVGGRAMASAEALYASVVLGDEARSIALFEAATDPNLFFHHIFNVFRVWCVGLFLSNRHRELKELLRHHQYAPGLRGGYVQAFIGLLAQDRRHVQAGLKSIARHEWEIWQDPRLVRGAGVVNLGATALVCMAHRRGLGVASVGPTVPEALTPKRALPARPAAGP